MTIVETQNTRLKYWFFDININILKYWYRYWYWFCFLGDIDLDIDIGIKKNIDLDIDLDLDFLGGKLLISILILKFLFGKILILILIQNLILSHLCCTVNQCFRLRLIAQKGLKQRRGSCSCEERKRTMAKSKLKNIELVARSAESQFLLRQI